MCKETERCEHVRLIIAAARMSYSSSVTHFLWSFVRYDKHKIMIHGRNRETEGRGEREFAEQGNDF